MVREFCFMLEELKIWGDNDTLTEFYYDFRVPERKTRKMNILIKVLTVCLLLSIIFGK